MATRFEKMTKEDLKSGFLVELKSGKLKLVTRAGGFTKILVGSNGHWSYLSRWDDNLNRKHEIGGDHSGNETIPAMREDIVKVYGLIEGTSNYCLTASPFTTTGRKLLWSRIPPRRMTLEMIEKQLGFPVELVSDASPDDIF